MKNHLIENKWFDSFLEEEIYIIKWIFQMN